MRNCIECKYAKRDNYGRFLNTCNGHGNCDFQPYKGNVKPWPIDQMKKMLIKATMSKFSTPDRCEGFREGVKQCIKIMEDENKIH